MPEYVLSAKYMQQDLVLKTNEACKIDKQMQATAQTGSEKYLHNKTCHTAFLKINKKIQQANRMLGQYGELQLSYYVGRSHVSISFITVGV